MGVDMYISSGRPIVRLQHRSCGDLDEKYLHDVDAWISSHDGMFFSSGGKIFFLGREDFFPREGSLRPSLLDV